MRYKGHTIPDKTVDEMMRKLNLSLEEACDLVLCDMGIEEDETVEELTKKAHKNRITVVIHDAKGEKKQRKPKERKENPLKKEIIQIVFNALYDNLWVKENDFVTKNSTICIRNNEKYIDFDINGREFTINLTEHRPPKEKKGEKK